MKKTAIIICSLVFAYVIAAATVITFATPAAVQTAKTTAKQTTTLQPSAVLTTAATTTQAASTTVTTLHTETKTTEAESTLNHTTTASITETRPTSAPKTAATEPTAASTTEKQTSAFITAAKAKEIALKDAGIKKSKAVFTKTQLEKDDGIYEYEIEFYVGLTEYEYSVNAKTGAITEKDIDIPEVTIKSEPTTQQTTAAQAERPTSFISINKAKKIALSHAGLDENNVHIKKVKLDKDDGIYEYEVEFIANGLEYEYSVDAKDGRIINFEVEKDD